MEYNHLQEKITKYRHELHQIPELSFGVYETNKYVLEKLEKLSCRLAPIVETGIIAYFDFGCSESIAFRSDMDGLPIQEVNNFDYVSTHNGLMHACGHDSHMAILLGFAEVLDEMVRSGKKARYNAVLLFQPAEETIDGAFNICKTDFFKEYKVKAIFGLHNWPTLPKGKVASRQGPMMAKSTEVNVNFVGKSAHCGKPEDGHDALLAACKFVNEIYEFKENEIKDFSVLKFGKLESGNVRNAISPKSTLLGTMRTFSEDTWNALVDKMNEICEKIYAELGVKVDSDVSKYHPAVINDETYFGKVAEILSHNDEIDFCELESPVLIAEDFSFFQECVPGVFFFLGTGSNIPLHSNNYFIDDEILIKGVKLFESIFTHL